jgi:uncharacterized protein
MSILDIIMQDIIIFSILIIFIAFFFGSVFGFGSGLISVSILSILLGVKEGVTLLMIFQFLIGLILTFTIYKQLKFEHIKFLILGLIIGLGVGMFLLSTLDNQILKKILGIFILIYLIKELFFKKIEIRPKLKKQFGFLMGLLAGFFQGLSGTGGPPLVIYYNTIFKEKKLFRAHLILTLLITNSIRIGPAWFSGLITNEIINLALIILPFFLISIYIGSKLHLKVEEDIYKKTIYVILFFSAISLIIK